jgi:hypothetical protein
MIALVKRCGSWTEGHLLASRRDDLARAYALSIHPSSPRLTFFKERQCEK